MTKTLIAAVGKTVDNQGSMQQCLDLEARITRSGTDIHHLYIEPLAKDWHEPSLPNHFKSGCAPIEALARAAELITQGASAVLIIGQDNLKSDYSRQERLDKMNIYASDYPITQAYTDLALQFIANQNIDEEQFKVLANHLFENYQLSYQNALGDDFSPSMLPAKEWYHFITELFRGVDCANPMIDFSGRVLLLSDAQAQSMSLEPQSLVEVKGVGLGILDHDGPEYIEQIARFDHLASAYQQCCEKAEIDFAASYIKGQALLETYTCFPVVPMAFLLACGLVDELEDMPDFLQRNLVTVTGGMNLARAPWNNPALNGIISMYRRLIEGPQSMGMVHGNGGLGYRQGVALLKVL